MDLLVHNSSAKMETNNYLKKYKVIPYLRFWENLQKKKYILTLMSYNVRSIF